MEIETILRYSLKTNESMISLMWNLKYDTNEFIYKTEADSQTESQFTVTKGERKGGIN